MFSLITTTFLLNHLSDGKAKDDGHLFFYQAAEVTVTRAGFAMNMCPWAQNSSQRGCLI